MNTGNVLQKIWALPIVMLLAAFTFVGQTNAQTFYVDGATGNDNWDGSTMTFQGAAVGPWKTLTKALAAAEGSTIVVLAGQDYSASGLITNAKNMTLQVRTDGANLNVTVDGFNMNTAGKTITLAEETGGSGGRFVTNGGVDLALTAGTLANNGNMTLGGDVTRQNGAMTGSAPTFAANHNVTYGAPAAAITSAYSAGVELAASLGTGTLTFQHTGNTITVPNAVSAASVTSTTTGGVTFSSNVTASGAAANAFNVGGGATVAVNGTLTSSNAAGGINVAGASSLSAGATTVSSGANATNGQDFAHAGTGTVTLASLTLSGGQSSVNYSSTGTFTVTGAVTAGLNTGAAQNALNNTGTGTMTIGSFATSPIVDTAGNDNDNHNTAIANASTGRITINGAITEAAVTEAQAGNGTEYTSVSLINAVDGTISIGASTTLRGDINNAERSVVAATTDGIVLLNNATLTLPTLAVANITSFGDIVGGTLVVDYVNGLIDGTVTAGRTITQAGNVTFTANVSGAPGAGALGALNAGVYSVSGDVRIQDAALALNTQFILGGTLFLEAATITNASAAASDVNGLNISAAGATYGGAMTVRGTVAALNNATITGAFTASSADVTAVAGASFGNTFTAKSLSVSGAGTVTMNNAINTTGGVTVANGTTLNATNLTAGSDIGGLFDINGTVTIGGGGTLGLGTMDIDAATGSLTTAGATTFNFDGASFTGGTWTDTGSNDIVNFAIPSSGATISPKAGTVWGQLGITGSGRTATFTQSITVAGNVTVGNDATVALGNNSIVMTGAAATLTLTDEAAITNTGSTGGLQMNGNAQVITVAGAPNTTPTLSNIVVNNAGAVDLTIDEPINISGTLELLDGGVEIDGATGANAAAIAVTFTGANARIARFFPNEGIDLVATNSIAGTYDLVANGAAGAPSTFGAEYSASQIRNLTIATTAGNVTTPGTTATISGNLNISDAAALFTTVNPLTVQGNATVTGSLALANTLTLNGALTTVNNATGGDITGAGVFTFAGANQTHTHAGIFTAPVSFAATATGVTVNGSIAAGDADGDSEFGAITSAAGSSATLNNIQDVNGAVAVTGTLTVNLVSDGAAVADTDGQFAAAVTVNNGGSFTASSNDATGSFAAGITVIDGGTFTAGSNLGSGAASVVGNGSQTTPAMFDLNGNTFSTGAFTFTMNPSAAPATAPTFGTTGTLNVTAGGSLVGATNPTIPNVTLNGGGATEIDSDITVTGTFTVAALSNGANGDNVTLSGASAVGQFNANYTATIGTAGSTIITTGTSINSTVNGVVNITNLNVNSTSTTTLAYNGAVAAGATDFQVNFLNHDAGVLDITNETFTLLGDSGAGDDWDYDGGSYAGTGSYVMNGAGGFEIDMSTNGATVTIPNLTVNGAANSGFQLDAAGDGVIVSGTLTLNGAGPNVETEVGANDASFAMANGSTIVRTSAGAADHFDNTPTLGTGMTVRYTAAGATTTANELPAMLSRLEWEGAATLTLEDARALTLDYLEMANNIDIDANDDGDNSIAVTAGGTIEYDGAAADFVSVGTDEVPSFAGAANLLFSGGFGATAINTRTWPAALVPAVSITSVGANNNVTVGTNRSATSVTVGDGSATNTSTLTIGATLTVSGAVTINADGTVGGGTLDANGTVTNSGALTSAVLASQSITLTGNLTNLTLDGSAAQTLTVPAGGSNVQTLVVNNTAGVTVAGGNVAVGIQLGAGTTSTGITGGLTLTNGVLNMSGNTLLMSHAGSGIQGYTRTNGCVYGNVRKQLSNTGATAPSDRLEFPLCSMGGVYRPYAITFNNPNTIGGTAPNNGGTAPGVTTAPAITVKHDVSGENGVAELTGTNGLPQMTNGVNIARYPTGASFFWTVSPSFTMSPSLSYDVDMRANDYSNFSSSCGTAACDINEIYPIRRHVGSNSNLWSVATSTIDNFLAGADDPVVVGRAATGALQTSGTVFTYGLKSIFAASGTAPAVTITTGNTHVVDLSTLFTGYTGALTYTAVSSDDTDVTAPGTGNVAGNNLTLTGGSKAAAATVTVNATNSFGSTASATFTVTNGAALTASADDLSRTLNVGDTSTVTFASAFTGGAGAVTYTAASSDASVTVASDGTTVTMTAASNGSATITLTGVDASTTAVTVTKTFTVTVNNAVSVANAVADQTVLQGATATVDVSNVFANGTGAVTVAVSGGNTTASATIAGNTVTITGLAAYSGTPLADTAPVTVTLTGTDTIGGSATDAFDVTVNPVAGAVSGGGAVSAFDASLILNEFLGKSSPALTAKQLVAADFDGDNDIDPFDAYQVYVAAGGAPKADIRDAFASADVAFGEMTQNGTIISLPIVITGDVAEAAAISFQTMIDPAIAQVAEVVNNSDWMMVTDIAEDGTVRLAAIGGESLPADGVVATININVPETFASFMLNGQGAVNNNTISEIDAVEVIEIPGTFALEGNYPNPFNPTTTIQFDLPESADVEVQIFDMIGRQVMSIPSQTIAAGAKRSLQLNASQLASGSYFYRVVAKMKDSVAIDTGRMTLVK